MAEQTHDIVMAQPATLELAHRDFDPDALDVVARGRGWADELSKEMNARAPLIMGLRAYFAGDHPIRFASDAWRETFGEEFGPMVDNWCRIVIEAATERMDVQGFLFDPDPEATVDQDAWETWRRSRMNLDSDIAHTDALTTGYSYALVWRGPDGRPEITVEDPLNAIVELDPANRRRRVAGMKRWRRRNGVWNGLVFTPDRWWHVELGREGWEVMQHGPMRIGLVPLVPLINTPDVYGRGWSDLMPILALQDGVNKLSSDEFIASEFTAYRQRVLIGVEVPVDEETGDPKYDWVGGINRWLAIEDSEAKVFELQANDLSNYHGAIEQLVQHIGALTRTPPHYLLGKIVNVTADALRAAESGLAFRVRRRNRLFGETWVECQRIAFALMGDEERASRWQAETKWADPETVSMAALVDSLQKLHALGLPREMIFERLGLTPGQVERAMNLAEREALTDGLRLGFTANGAAAEPEPAAV